MNIEVRDYSKLEIKNHSAGTGAPAVSVTDGPELKTCIDILYLCGAPYANIMAPELKEYAERLDKRKVGRVILFTTSNWPRRTALALKKLLKEKGIPVDADYFCPYAQYQRQG